MSGLEGIAALGLACSIFQVISFGRETLGVIKSVYRDGALDNSLLDKSTAIQAAANEIIDVDIPQSGNHEKKLLDVTKQCVGVARELRDEIAFLVCQNGQGSLCATLRIAAKVKWRKRRLDRMEKALSDAEQLMQTTLLAWIFKSANSTFFKMDSLRDEVRDFVIKYEHGSTQASQLVSSEALQVRDVVVQQSGKTKEAIQTQITQISANLEQRLDSQIEDASRKRLQKRLLRSLKYPQMNERANDIDTAHAQTFHWLFADFNDLSYSDKTESWSDSLEAPTDEDQHSGDDILDYVMDGWSIKALEPPQMAWSSFADWLQSDLSIYWIVGKPGCGKSTLMKFIPSEPRTRIALANWRSDAIIIGHYFWRSGSVMQRSIKGMLCSFIFQLVLSSPLASTMEYISANDVGVKQKDSVSDWSVSELQQLCLGLTGHIDIPLCLLIDGLDECTPQHDQHKLLEILDSIPSPTVKIIVSSRNEPIFEKRFRHEPQLRVQDLTAADLLVYAKDMLPDEIQVDLSIDGLVHRADGVFLWLVLVVLDIKRGYINGEQVSDLQRRAKRFPKGLIGLYKDIWKRSNEDNDHYRESAALYFKLVMVDYSGRLRTTKWGMSILAMMLASIPETHSAFARRTFISPGDLANECEQFHKQVRVRCAGLLGLNGRLDDFPLAEGLTDEERALLKYSTQQVEFRFIHRSVYDFLVGTPEGQDLLSHDRTHSEDIEIRVIQARLRSYQLLAPILGKLKEYGGYELEVLPKQLGDYLTDLSHIADARNRSSRKLTSLCYELYISSQLPLRREDVSPTRSAAFVGTAATYLNLVGFATSVFKNKLVGSEVRSAVLLSLASARCYWDCNQTGSSHLQKAFPLKLVRRLLSLPDVNVNLKCPVIGMPCQFRIPDGQPFLTTGALEHIMISPFEKLICSGLLRLNWKEAGTPRHRYIRTQFLQLVSDFVYHGADLGSTLLIAISPDYRMSQLRRDRNEVLPGFFQIPDNGISDWCRDHQDDDGILCVVTLQACTAIQRMLASLPKTESDCDNMNNDEYSTEEDDFSTQEDCYSSLDLEKAASLLSQKCSDSSIKPNNHTLGILQPCGNFSHTPYRQVSEDDADHLIDMIWSCIFEPGVTNDALEMGCREVIKRSPFSSIGFRQYMMDMGCFDRDEAYDLQMEYKYDRIFTTAPMESYSRDDPRMKKLMSTLERLASRITVS